MNRCVPLFLALATGWLATAVNAQVEKKIDDEKLAKLIVGKWEHTERADVKVTITFTGDDKYSAEMELGKDKKQQSGTWKIDKGTLLTTITKSTDKGDEGIKDKTKIISIDDTTLKLTLTAKSDKLETERTIEFKKVK